MGRRGELIVISGCSGSGKGTVLKQLFDKYEDFCYSVSATTRKPREGEQEGINYFFINKEQFMTLIDTGEMLEYAEYAGNLYGTPRSYVLTKLGEGKNVILEIEVKGAKQIKEAIPEAILVFITPENYEVLTQRLSGRGTEPEEIIQKRLEIAVDEIKEAKLYDHIVVNPDDMAESAADAIADISRGKYSGGIDADQFITSFLRDIRDITD